MLGAPTFALVHAKVVLHSGELVFAATVDLT